MKEIFLKYSDSRDVIFIMGAGASHPDGVPLKKDILPYILSGKDDVLTNSFIGSEVIKFIHDNFIYDAKDDYFPRLEGVFGFLDYFIHNFESLSSEYNTSKLLEIREYLIKLTYYVVNLHTDKNSETYHKFWELVQVYNKNISVITLNYDTLLEQAFDFLFKRIGYIDYGIHLMNYEKLKGLERFNFWVNPGLPILAEDNYNPVPFKIIKLHGSLNWKYCNCCNQTLLTPWDRHIDLNKGKFLGYTYPENIRYEYSCPIDKTDFQTLIMPPSYSKSIDQPVIKQLFSEASREIRIAKKIVFVGYSFSSSDVHIKALLNKNMTDDVEVIVVNPKLNKKLRMKYLSVSKNCKFYEMTFEEFLANEELIQKVLLTR